MLSRRVRLVIAMLVPPLLGVGSVLPKCNTGLKPYVCLNEQGVSLVEWGGGVVPHAVVIACSGDSVYIAPYNLSKMPRDVALLTQDRVPHDETQIDLADTVFTRQFEANGSLVTGEFVLGDKVDTVHAALLECSRNVDHISTMEEARPDRMPLIRQPDFTVDSLKDTETGLYVRQRVVMPSRPFVVEILTGATRTEQGPKDLVTGRESTSTVVEGPLIVRLSGTVAEEDSTSVVDVGATFEIPSFTVSGDGEFLWLKVGRRVALMRIGGM